LRQERVCWADALQNFLKIYLAADVLAVLMQYMLIEEGIPEETSATRILRLCATKLLQML